MTENTCTFTPDTMTIDNQDFPASYAVPPHGDGSVFVFVTVQGKQIRIRIAPEDPRHAAALAAAQGYTASTSEPANGVIVAETHIDITRKAEPVQEQPQEEPASDPKQARGPVPDKAWIGTSIQGNGWKIEFCPVMERTRLIFDKVPTKEARELVKAAGFAWSPKMGSWNKRLTWKAYRAAQQLAADLGGLKRRAC